MKKIIAAISLGALVALSSLAIGAEKKAKSKESEKPTAAKTEHIMFSGADLKWVDGPPSLPAGVKMAVLEGDPGKPGPFTIRLQAPAGWKVPPHTHPSAERITVISGSFNMGMGPKFDESAGHQMAAGAFAVMPIGTQHFAWSTSDSIVQVESTGPFQIKYVNPADDPRTAKK